MPARIDFCTGETENFVRYLHLVQAEVPESQISPSLTHQVMQMINFKFCRLSESIITLDAVSSMSSLILLRALTELTIDACYLAFKNEEMRYKRFWNLGEVDSLKNQICQINLGVDFPETRTSSIEAFQEIQLNWPSKYKPLLLLFNAKTVLKIENLFKEKITSPLSIENIQVVNRKMLEYLGSISNWYAPKENQYQFFEELEPILSRIISSENVEPASGLQDFYNSINQYGNSAVHSSVTLNYTCLTDGHYTFDAKLDVNPGYVPCLAATMLRLLQWALWKAGLISDEGNVRILSRRANATPSTTN